eukprot:TRINITY_DN43147_c0_g1_i1.p2 TRINITY_DN43147_c0_g1~~TRINITY_DN43147_c0_g1_i1.p2  ORF type:complete len:197 (+),score=43.15 TRINITY_DN43147_c0_g1_i1:247-837(+)
MAAFTTAKRAVGVTLSAARIRHSAQQHRSASLQLNGVRNMDQHHGTNATFCVSAAEGVVSGALPSSSPFRSARESVDRDFGAGEDFALGSKQQPPLTPRLRPSEPPAGSDDMPELILPRNAAADFEFDSLGFRVTDLELSEMAPPNAPLLRCAASPSEMPPPLELPPSAMDLFEDIKEEGGIVFFHQSTSAYVRTD